MHAIKQLTEQQKVMFLILSKSFSGNEKEAY